MPIIKTLFTRISRIRPQQQIEALLKRIYITFREIIIIAPLVIKGTVKFDVTDVKLGPRINVVGTGGTNIYIEGAQPHLALKSSLDDTTFQITYLGDVSPIRLRIQGEASLDGFNIVYNTGNVGIGQTTPGSKLSVSGEAAIGTGPYSLFTAPTGGLIVEGNTGIGLSSNIDAKLQVNGQIAVVDGMAEPAAITGYASIYVDSADGALKVKFSNGTVKTITTNP